VKTFADVLRALRTSCGHGARRRAEGRSARRRGARARRQCESEVKAYQALDTEKLRLDRSVRAYQIEYQCLSDTVDPRRAKGK